MVVHRRVVRWPWSRRAEVDLASCSWLLLLRLGGGGSSRSRLRSVGVARAALHLLPPHRTGHAPADARQPPPPAPPKPPPAGGAPTTTPRASALDGTFFFSSLEKEKVPLKRSGETTRERGAPTTPRERSGGDESGGGGPSPLGGEGGRVRSAAAERRTQRTPQPDSRTSLHVPSDRRASAASRATAGRREPFDGPAGASLSPLHNRRGSRHHRTEPAALARPSPRTPVAPRPLARTRSARRASWRTWSARRRGRARTGTARAHRARRAPADTAARPARPPRGPPRDPPRSGVIPAASFVPCVARWGGIAGAMGREGWCCHCSIVDGGAS